MKQSHKARFFGVSLLAVAVLAVVVALLVSSDDPRHPGGLLVTPSTRQTAAGGQGPAVVYVSDDLYPATLELVARFLEDNPRSKIELHQAPGLGALADVQKDKKATLFIDDQKVIAQMAHKPPRSFPFGNDLLLIVAAKGNPKGIDSLLTFADQANRTGMCAPEIRCGADARNLLAAHSVTAVPDVVSPDPKALVDDVFAGRLDAALVYRSQARTKFLRVSGLPAAAPDDPNSTVDYEMAVLTPNTTTAQFVQFVRNSPDATRILQRRGFKGLVRAPAESGQ